MLLCSSRGCCAPRRLRCTSTDHQEELMLEVKRSVTVMRSARRGLRVLARSREPAALHAASRSRDDDGRSAGRTGSPTAPAGTTVEWDAEILEDRAGELIAWRSVDRSDVRNEGVVRFTDAPADRGTEVHVELRYDAPAGKAGAAVAKLVRRRAGAADSRRPATIQAGDGNRRGRAVGRQSSEGPVRGSSNSASRRRQEPAEVRR